jgi:hypothetical protein
MRPDHRAEDRAQVGPLAQIRRQPVGPADQRRPASPTPRRARPPAGREGGRGRSRAAFVQHDQPRAVGARRASAAPPRPPCRRRAVLDLVLAAGPRPKGRPVRSKRGQVVGSTSARLGPGAQPAHGAKQMHPHRRRRQARHRRGAAPRAASATSSRAGRNRAPRGGRHGRSRRRYRSAPSRRYPCPRPGRSGESASFSRSTSFSAMAATCRDDRPEAITM